MPQENCDCNILNMPPTFDEMDDKSNINISPQKNPNDENNLDSCEVTSTTNVPMNSRLHHLLKSNINFCIPCTMRHTCQVRKVKESLNNIEEFDCNDKNNHVIPHTTQSFTTQIVPKPDCVPPARASVIRHCLNQNHVNYDKHQKNCCDSYEIEHDRVYPISGDNSGAYWSDGEAGDNKRILNNLEKCQEIIDRNTNHYVNNPLKYSGNTNHDCIKANTSSRRISLGAPRTHYPSANYDSRSRSSTRAPEMDNRNNENHSATRVSQVPEGLRRLPRHFDTTKIPTTGCTRVMNYDSSYKMDRPQEGDTKPYRIQNDPCRPHYERKMSRNIESVPGYSAAGRQNQRPNHGVESSYNNCGMPIRELKYSNSGYRGDPDYGSNRYYGEEGRYCEKYYDSKMTPEYQSSHQMRNPPPSVPNRAANYRRKEIDHLDKTCEYYRTLVDDPADYCTFERGPKPSSELRHNKACSYDDLRNHEEYESGSNDNYMSPRAPREVESHRVPERCGRRPCYGSRRGDDYRDGNAGGTAGGHFERHRSHDVPAYRVEGNRGGGAVAGCSGGRAVRHVPTTRTVRAADVPMNFRRPVDRPIEMDERRERDDAQRCRQAQGIPQASYYRY